MVFSMSPSKHIGARAFDIFKGLFPLVPVVLFLVLGTIGNVDLINGRFALFMDERVTFDGVRAILHSDSFPEFVYGIYDGGDHRYGRILWYSMAFFSFIPELLFGEVGQIIASRSLQTIFLALAVSIFAFSLLKNWMFRAVFGIVALSVPYMSYFSSMPKPEPLQILLLSLYFMISFRNGIVKLFGLHWVLLGLAFGAKISTLPAVAVILLVALMASKNREPAKLKFHSGLAFLGGLGLAVPILFVPMSMVVAIGWFYQKLDTGKFKELNYSLALASILSVSALLFINDFARWVDFTFLNTSHGSDQSSINIISWMVFLVSDWISSYPLLSIVLLVSCGFLCFTVGLYGLRDGRLLESEIMAPLLILASGTALSLSIMMSAERLWGMYLFPGAILQIVGIFMLLELSLRSREEVSRRVYHRLTAGGSFVVVASLALTSGLVWIPESIKEHERNAQRTASAEFQSDYEAYLELEKFLDSFVQPANRKAIVAAAPAVFHRESDSRFDVWEFYGPFTNWNEEIDIVILAEANTPQGIPTSEQSPDYGKYVLEQEGYGLQVTTLNNVCSKDPCWKLAVQLTNGAQILVRDE